jgi:hypothetical protein
MFQSVGNFGWVTAVALDGEGVITRLEKMGE